VAYFSRTAERINMHVILNEQSNSIELHYTNITAQQTRNIVVGVDNYGGTFSQSFMYNGTSPTSSLIRTSVMFTPRSTHMCDADPCVSQRGTCIRNYYGDYCSCTYNYNGKFCESTSSGWEPYYPPPNYHVHLSGGAIAGIVIASVALCMMIICSIVCCCKRRRRILLMAHQPLQNVQIPPPVNNAPAPLYPQKQPFINPYQQVPVAQPVVHHGYQPTYVSGPGYAPIQNVTGYIAVQNEAMPPAYEPIPLASAPGGPSPSAPYYNQYQPVANLETDSIEPSAPFLN